MTQASSVLILGARGRFGLAAARAFAQAGWQVLGQVRPGAVGPVVPGVRWLAADPGDTAALAALAQGAQVVVHALNPPYTNRAWRTQAPALMAAAIGLSRALGATLMLPGNVYNFGTSMPALLREETAQQASTVKGRIRIALEQQLAAATRDAAMKAVVIRAGNFFGSGTGSWFDRVIVKDLQRGKLIYPGPMNVPTAWAYLPDLARSFVEVAGRRNALPAFETLHFAGDSLSGQDWLDALIDIAWEQGWLPAGGRLRVAAMPWALMRLVSPFAPMVASLLEMHYLWQVPHALDGTALARCIGPEPHTPLPEALRAALADLGLLAPAMSRPQEQLQLANGARGGTS
ncbi:MAG: NAD-dependent epimerase/dehydratase family protein [Polaromonas sp.]